MDSEPRAVCVCSFPPFSPCLILSFFSVYLKANVFMYVQSEALPSPPFLHTHTCSYRACTHSIPPQRLRVSSFLSTMTDHCCRRRFLPLSACLSSLSLPLSLSLAFSPQLSAGTHRALAFSLLFINADVRVKIIMQIGKYSHLLMGPWRERYNLPK